MLNEDFSLMLYTFMFVGSCCRCKFTAEPCYAQSPATRGQSIDRLWKHCIVAPAEPGSAILEDLESTWREPAMDALTRPGTTPLLKAWKMRSYALHDSRSSLSTSDTGHELGIMDLVQGLCPGSRLDITTSQHR